MTAFYSVARAMECVGLRWVSLGMARLLGQPYLPPVSRSDQALNFSLVQLTEVCRGSKYFAIGNLIRLGFGAPIWIALSFAKSPLMFGLFSLLMAFHLVCAVSDAYRLAVGSALLPFANPASPEVEAAPAQKSRRHIYFTPKRFETVRFYKLIGGEWAQGRVTWYDGIVRRTAKEKAESESYHYVESTSLDGLIRFEQATRSAEVTHLVAGLVNFAATIVLALRLSPAAIFGAATAWFDFGLVVLQRYSRVRVNQLISILERKAERAAKRATS